MKSLVPHGQNRPAEPGLERTPGSTSEDATLGRITDFRRAFDQVAIGMALVGLDGRWINVNPAVCQIVGYSEKELHTTNFQSITHPDDLDADLKFVGQMLRGEIRSYQMEKRYFHKAGHIVWVLLSVSLVYGAESDPLFFFSQIQDITERKRAEERLRQSEESYRLLVEQSPDAMLVHRQGTIVFANSFCASLLGVSPENELVGKEFLDFVHPDDRDAVKQRIAEFCEDFRNVRQNEHRFISQDGRETYAEVVARSVMYLGRAATQVMFRDISKRKRAEFKLRRSEANLAAAQRIAHLGSFEQHLSNLDDLDVSPLRCSDEVFRIFGFEPGQIEVSRTNFLRTVHAHDRKRVHEVVAKGFRDRKSYSMDYRITLPNGAERIIHSESDVICDATTRKPLCLVGTVQDITERTQMEDALRRSEANFRSLVENSPYGVLRIAADGKILQVNRAVIEMLGYSAESDVLNLNITADVYRYPGDRSPVLERFLKTGTAKDIEMEWKCKDGTPIVVRSSGHAVKNANGVIAHYEVMVEDITERRALENQLRQAQKMEAVGRLAGGVAHDFNNLLGVIVGYAELLLDQCQEGDAPRKHIEQIKKAGERAASLTRQLLAFSRQQVFAAKVLDLNAAVTDIEQMLRRLIGEHIELRTSLDPALGRVKADQGQVEQIIMNLAVNARDAMPEGGRLVIETNNIGVDEAYAHLHPPMIPGSYVLLTVSDTGIGMDAQTQAHIFEPFFTTKGQGKGTGLGLATIYGVVKQSGGYIWVDSELRVGSTLKVFLPRVDEVFAPSRPSVFAPGIPQGSETILLVEDEESLRTLTRTLLEQAGYTVLEASDGGQAMEIARQHRGSIHLLLTDVVMPGMNGHAVAESLARIHPETTVVYMSGYTGFTQSGFNDSDTHLLQKPFTRDALLRKLHEAFELKEPAR
jgi:two-component system, cell cycle sensor histidine kinase and response regulator CckA